MTGPLLEAERFLHCRVGSRHCALPLGAVSEIMRPLPIEPLAGAPDFVLGLSIVRGSPVPVVDGASLLGAPGEAPARFVLLKAGARRVALAVGAVLGIRPLPEASLGPLPPLLREARAEAVTAVGLLDGDLLLVLRSGHVLSASGLQASAPDEPGSASS